MDRDQDVEVELYEENVGNLQLLKCPGYTIVVTLATMQYSRYAAVLLMQFMSILLVDRL